MEIQIKNILEDLYRVDPELKNHEVELIEMINKLLKSKPDTKLDEKFIQDLKTEILKRVDELKVEKKSVFELIFVNKISYAFVGAAIMLVLVVGVFPIFKKFTGTNPLSLNTESQKIAFDQEIRSLKDIAFGPLKSKETLNGSMTAKGFGGGGGGGLASPLASQESITVDSKIGIPYYERINYNYSYVGDDINISENEMDVYKRIKNSSNSSALTQAVSNFNIGLLDLSKLDNTEIDFVILNENREFGYSVSINFRENNISLYPNWVKWPHSESKCQDQACYESYQLKAKDMPEDSTLVDIAKSFVKEYGIDISQYGEPIVQNTWANLLSQPEAYIYTEEIPVVFPLEINSQQAYDWGGNSYGLFVNINIRHKKVSSAYNIVQKNYESSKYPVISDSEKIINLAKQGGLTASYNYPDPTKIIDIKLGTPSFGLIQYYKYNNKKNESEELYVPGLIFPVISVSDESYFAQKNIIIPLIEDLIETPQIMPMREPGVIIEKPIKVESSIDKPEETIENN